MRISDWSSDVCSSDLSSVRGRRWRGGRRTRRRLPSSSGQAENVGHPITPGGLSRQPERRLHRAPGEDLARLGAVADLDALPLTRKDHLMVARDRSAPHHRKADVTFPARAGDAVAGAVCHLVELDPAPRRRARAQEPDGARTRIHLVALFHLHQLYTPIASTNSRVPLHKLTTPAHAQTCLYTHTPP